MLDGCRLCVPIEVKEQSRLKRVSWLVVGAVPDLPFIFDDVSTVFAHFSNFLKGGHVSWQATIWW